MGTTFHASPDVVVIGGGIIGCSIALRLAQARLQVLVIDRGEPGMEASSAAAGMLAAQGETTEIDLFAELCLESRGLYAGFVEEIEALSGERAGYRRDGELLLAANEAERKSLEGIVEAQSRAGLAIERLARKELEARAPGLAPEVETGVFIPGDHTVNNEKLMQLLVEAARRSGVRFSPHTIAAGFETSNGRAVSVQVRSSSSLSTATEPVPASHFVLAAGVWSGELGAGLGLDLRMEPCCGQLIEFESPHPLPFVLRVGHHYLVPRDGNRVVAGTTAEYVGFEKRVTAEGLAAVIGGVGRFAPWIGQARFLRAWAGLRPDTADHFPLLGLAEWPNLVFATGHFRNGILLAPVTARIIADLVLTGKTTASVGAYRPSRFSD